MNQDGAEHLMGIGDVAVAAFLLQARRAMNFLGGEIASAIEGEQIMALEKDERFQSVAALELAKDVGEGRAELLRVNLVKDGAHLGVAGDLLEAEHSFEVELITSPLIVESFD